MQMSSFDGAKVGAAIVIMVREFVAQHLDGLGEQFKSVAARIDALEKREAVPGPAGDKGEQGERGEDGAQGAQGEAGAAGRDGTDGADGKDGAPGPQGEAGAPGNDGKAGPVGAQGERGLDGKDGQNGQDGKSVSVEDVEQMVAIQVRAALDDIVAKAAAAVPVPKDGLSGRDGRDAVQLEILPAVVPEKAYPRNTYAVHAGGLIRAFRDTDAIDLAEIEKSGWETVLNGVAEEYEKMLEDGRTIQRTTVYTNGQKFERQYKSAAIRYRNVYQEGTEYFKGDVVTWGGESWHCNEDHVKEAPKYDHGGTSPWSIFVKKGRDFRPKDREK